SNAIQVNVLAPALLLVKFHDLAMNDVEVTCTARALIRPFDPTAITTGGTVNLPAGKVTVFSTTPPFGAAFGCSSDPVTTSPDMTPLRPIFKGPQCPAPSPRTLNVPDADSNTDDS